MPKLQRPSKLWFSNTYPTIARPHDIIKLILRWCTVTWTSRNICCWNLYHICIYIYIMVSLLSRSQCVKTSFKRCNRLKSPLPQRSLWIILIDDDMSVHWLQKPQLLFSIIMDHSSFDNLSVEITWPNKHFEYISMLTTLFFFLAGHYEGLK